MATKLIGRQKTLKIIETLLRNVGIVKKVPQN